jgi:hypothetical protein
MAARVRGCSPRRLPTMSRQGAQRSACRSLASSAARPPAHLHRSARDSRPTPGNAAWHAIQRIPTGSAVTSHTQWRTAYARYAAGSGGGRGGGGVGNPLATITRMASCSACGSRSQSFRLAQPPAPQCLTEIYCLSHRSELISIERRKASEYPRSTPSTLPLPRCLGGVQASDLGAWHIRRRVSHRRWHIRRRVGHRR